MVPAVNRLLRGEASAPGVVAGGAGERMMRRTHWENRLNFDSFFCCRLGLETDSPRSIVESKLFIFMGSTGVDILAFM